MLVVFRFGLLPGVVTYPELGLLDKILETEIFKHFFPVPSLACYILAFSQREPSLSDYVSSALTA